MMEAKINSEQGMINTYPVSSIEELYRAISEEKDKSAQAVSVLLLMDWFNRIPFFDPQTGEPSPGSLSSILMQIGKISGANSTETLNDRLFRIIEHVNEAIDEITRKHRTRILREHVIMPAYAARELDSSSIIWLNRKTGRNIREKLAGRPYLKAVKRRSSINTAENRLFKAFCLRLEELLQIRTECFKESDDGLVSGTLNLIERWFVEPDIDEIRHWGNTPPNNALLQDRNYRKIWDAWLSLHNLNTAIVMDQRRKQKDWMTVLYWTIISKLCLSKHLRIPQQPCFFDYSKYSIYPALEKIDGLLTDGTICLSILKNGNIEYKIGNKTTRVTSFLNGNIIEVSINNGRKKTVSLNPSSADEIARIIVRDITGGSFCHLPEISAMSENKKRTSAKTIIDISTIHPRISDDNGSGKLSSRLLMQFWNCREHSGFPVELWDCNAIALHPDIITVSILDVLSERCKIESGLLSQASKIFTEKLAKSIDTEDLTYLVPDDVDDFTLERVRKNMNSCFKNSQPLPRSISSVFSWQGGEGFLNSDLKEGDGILILDCAGSSLSATLLIARHNNIIEEGIPETKGFTWERHPTVDLNNNYSSITTAIEILKKDDCPVSEEIGRLMGYQGLKDEENSVSWFDNTNNWYTPRSTSQSDNLCNPWRSLEQQQILDILDKNAYLYILTIGDVFADSKLIPPVRVKIGTRHLRILGYQKKLILGAKILSEWQSKIPDIPLWQDHLPELSIKVFNPGKGYYTNFELVNNKTVVPKRGKITEIKIDKSFTLPKPANNENYYEFQLIQGAEGRELQYMAYLKSPAFPLSQDTVCRLAMTYTYGADDPYELQFLPLNHRDAGFNSVKAEWKKSEKTRVTEIIVPPFPLRLAWKDFESYPKKGGGTSNLLEWIKDTLQLDELFESANYEKEVETLISNRNVGLFEWGTKDSKGSYYCRVKRDQESIACRSEQFVETINPDDLKAGDKVYFDLWYGPDGDNVSFTSICPDNLRKKYEEKFKQRLSEVCERKKKRFFSLRFPTLTVWSQGHSLCESEVPDCFRKSMHDRINDCLKALEDQTFLAELKDEIFFFLCCIHKDAPMEVSSELMQIIHGRVRNLGRFYKHIAFAIGDAELEWQANLFGEVLMLGKGNNLINSSIALRILGIALWRSEQLIFRFSYNDIDVLLYNLSDSIENKLSVIIKESMIDHLPYANPYVIMELELLLALLRTRGSQNENIKKILYPEKEIAKNFVEIVDEITKKICDANVDIRSRVKLQINKPEAFHNTPDLLYAIRLYLTGDSGANAIQISVDEDE